jgi:hypothetical protein
VSLESSCVAEEEERGKEERKEEGSKEKLNC